MISIYTPQLNRLHRTAFLFENPIHDADKFIAIFATDIVGHGHRLEVETRLEETQEVKRDEQKQGSKERREHESATGGHADGGDYEYRRGGGDAGDTSLGMEDGTCADEANARNDLRGDAGVITAKIARQTLGEDGEHC